MLTHLDNFTLLFDLRSKLMTTKPLRKIKTATILRVFGFSSQDVLATRYTAAALFGCQHQQTNEKKVNALDNFELSVVTVPSLRRVYKAVNSLTTRV